MDSVLDGLGQISESICCGPVCGGGGRGVARGGKAHSVHAPSVPADEDSIIEGGTSTAKVGDERRNETPPPLNQNSGGNVNADKSPTSVVGQIAAPSDPTALDKCPVPQLFDDLSPSDDNDDAVAAEEQSEEGRGEQRHHEEWDHALMLTASPWSAYLRGARRPKLFGTAPLYSEFRTRAATRRTEGGQEISALNGLAGAVARSIGKVGGVTNVIFTADKCLWKADYMYMLPSLESRKDAEGDNLGDGSGDGDDYRINVRIYSLDDEALGRGERKWKKQRGGEDSNSMEDFVITVRILCGKDEKPEVNRQAFRKVDSAVRCAAIHQEIPSYLEDFEGRNRCRRFADEYELGEELNSGAYAKVYRGTHLTTGDVRAIKVIDRAKLALSCSNDDSDLTAVLFEVLLQASLADHPTIVRLHNFYEESDRYYLVMEHMSGGDLFERIGEKETYNERDARDLVRNLLEALVYCHGNGVIHRDLKPKNMMLVDDFNDTFIKLADFGLSARTVGPESLLRLCGSPFYVAPELLLKRPYDESSDMWSVGVIAYLLLGGTVPFNGTSLKQIFQKVVDGKYDFNSECWTAVSNQAKDFVHSLLKREPSERPMAAEALESPWFHVIDKKLEGRNLQKSAASLRGFEARMKFKSAVFAVQGMQRLAGSRFQWQYGLEGIDETGAKNARNDSA